MEIKRTILWAIFTLSLVLLYDNWQRANGHASMFGGAPAVKQVTGNVPAVGAGKDAPPAAAASNPTAAGGVAGVAAVSLASAGEMVVISTDVLRAQVDTIGGTLSKLELLRHVDHDGKPVVLFDRSASHVYLARSGLIGAAEFPNHTMTFTVEPGARELGQGEQLALKLVAEKNGLRLAKTYLFKRGSYVVDVKFDVTNIGDTPLAPTLYTELARDGSKIEASSFYSTFTGPAVYTDTDKFQKVEFSDIDKGKAKFATSVEANQPGWVGMVQHYFASAWVPSTSVRREIYLNKVDNNFYRVGMQESLGTVASGASVSTSAKLFAGPQEERLLEAVAPGLELVKDYGWLTIIAKPLFWLLERIHGFVGNWGWAIVLLTVLIKLAFFPLSAASYKSMAKMKDLQPKMMALKERHKDDAQKMNQAMMEMYRKEKVNPLGGCFPILIQVPVFIALYWVLLSSVEMRNAPWIGWIHDLASPDPFYILPAVMAVSMFVQTKLNPTPPDPIQAKVMMIMPLAFSVMFFFFPAGLVLYWVVNNILSIAQQWQINRMIGGAKKPA